MPPASGTKVRVRVWESLADTWRNSYALDLQLNNYKPSQTTVCNYKETKACIPLIHFAKLQQPPHGRPQLVKQPNKVVLWKNERETVNRYSVMRHVLQNITGWHCKAKLLQLTCIECKIVGQWIHHGPNPELSSLHGSNHRFFDLKMSHMWYILPLCHVSSTFWCSEFLIKIMSKEKTIK